MKNNFRKVCIVGLGLIGGSLGMAIKKNRLGYVVGCTRHILNGRDLELKRKAADEISINAREAVLDSDLVILCAPVLTNLSWIRKMSQYVKPGAVVMDVGSTKQDICDVADKLLPGQFVGCHPMAGSEKSGIRNADANLYQGSICFMTSTDNKIEYLWKKIGAKTILVTPEAHDELVAKVSHIQHLFAFASVASMDISKAEVLNLAGHLNPSFKPQVRLAQSNPRLWADIFWSNRKALLKEIDKIESYFSMYKKILKSTHLGSGHQKIQKLVQTVNAKANALV